MLKRIIPQKGRSFYGREPIGENTVCDAWSVMRQTYLASLRRYQVVLLK